jgi:hypothetical protein
LPTAVAVALLLSLGSAVAVPSPQSRRRSPLAVDGPGSSSPGALSASLVVPHLPPPPPPPPSPPLPRTVLGLRALIDEDETHREALRVLGELYQVGGQ